MDVKHVSIAGTWTGIYMAMMGRGRGHGASQCLMSNAKCMQYYRQLL